MTLFIDIRENEQYIQYSRLRVIHKQVIIILYYDCSPARSVYVCR